MSNSDNRNILPVSSADIIRPEVQSSTKIINVKCKYIWTIQDFKSVCSIDGTILKSPLFSLTNKCKWFLEFISKSSSWSPRNYYSSLYLRSNDNVEIKESGFIAAELKCSIIDSRGEESNIDKTVFSIDVNASIYTVVHTYGFENFITYNDLLMEESKLLPKNIMTLKCEITFVKQESIITDVQLPPKIDEISFVEDFGKLFIKKDFSDVTIYVNDKKYLAHKSILAARSSVFEAMLKHNTKENELNRIDIVDIDDQVFLEALRFIYTGKVQNLETMAFELLAVADKYDLENLKIICEQKLHEMLSVETVVKILVTADMYNVQNLKKRSIDYFRTYSIDVTNCMDSESWNVLTSRPYLMKDVLEKYMDA